MLPFILALLFICAVAGAVVAAFAWPHLRAGSRVLTPRGEQVVDRFGGRLQPVSRVLGPRLRRVVRPVVRVLAPPARSARRRLEPVLEPVIRAVEEGSVARAQRPAARAQRPAARAQRPAAATGQVGGRAVPGPQPRSGSDFGTGPEHADDDPLPLSVGAASVGAASVGAASAGAASAGAAPHDRLEYVIQPFRPGRPERSTTAGHH